MTNSELFKAAHKMTKGCIQAGDCYAVVFGQSLKIIKAQHKRKTTLAKVGYTMSAAIQTVLITTSLVILALIISSGFAMVGAASLNYWLVMVTFGSLIIWLVKGIIEHTKQQLEEAA